jgi:hypothetical protein
LRRLRGDRGAKPIPPTCFLAAPYRRRPPHEVPRSSTGQCLSQPQSQMEPKRIAEVGELKCVETQPMRSNGRCVAMDLTCSSCAIESKATPLVAADNNT